MNFPRHILTVVTLLVGFSRTSAAADDRFGLIGPSMQAYVDKGEVMGAVTLVASKDKVLHTAAVGTSDGTRKMQVDDLFWIASMSKPITAVAAAMLVEDGKLNFDDPVEKFVPEFKNLKVDGKPLTRPITVRDLLNHTSGLPYNYDNTQLDWTLRQFVLQIASQPMKFQPGTAWDYSNAGIDVVGYVVQAASGMPFDQFLRKRLFDPLGMKDTTFWIAPGDMKRYARAYALDERAGGGKLPETPIMGVYGTEVTDKRRPPLGAAGIFSTAGDLARFYQLMLNRGKVGEKVLLKPTSVDALVGNQIGTMSSGNGTSWGYGFARIADPTALPSNAMLAPGTYGHMGLFGTNVWADPKREVVYVILFERGDIDYYFNSPIRTEFQALAVKALDGK